MDGVVQRERADCRREGRAVKNTKMLFRYKGDGLETMVCEGLARWHHLPMALTTRTIKYADGGVADERSSDVRQRDQI